MERIEPGNLIKLKTNLSDPDDTNVFIVLVPVPNNPDLELDFPFVEQKLSFSDKQVKIRYTNNDVPLMYLKTTIALGEPRERTYLPMIPPEPGEDPLFDYETQIEPPYFVHQVLWGSKAYYFTSYGETIETYFYPVSKAEYRCAK